MKKNKLFTQLHISSNQKILPNVVGKEDAYNTGSIVTNGGIIIDIDIINDCIQLRVKNNQNRIFQIKFDEAIIFQKISPQEKVILGVLNYLEK